MAYHWRLTFCLIVLPLWMLATPTVNLAQEPSAPFPEMPERQQPKDKVIQDSATVVSPELVYSGPPPGPHPPPLVPLGSPCCPPPKHGFFAGANLYVLRPFVANNTAFEITTGFTTRTFERTITEFAYDYDVSPVVCVGWIHPDGHVGFQFRYFSFDQEANELRASLNPAQARTARILPPSGLRDPLLFFGSRGTLLQFGIGQDILTFASDLDIDTVDVEAIWKVHHQCFQLDLTGGVRYLHLGQTYMGQLTNQGFAPTGVLVSELQLLTFNQTFDGGGPTLGLSGKYWIGPKGLALFGSARGSLLVGTLVQRTSFRTDVVDPSGLIDAEDFTGQLNIDRTSHDVLPVLELELGMEYGFPLGWGHAFLRAALVSQSYFGANNARGDDSNLSLFGAQFGVGYEY